MADFIYVDNSNLFIEGKRVSAVARGLAMNIQEATRDRILDHDYTLSFGRLHEFVAGLDQTQIARVVLFGSRPPPNDSIWTFAKQAGFELILEDRNAANKEKKIDTGIVSAMCRDAYRKADPVNDKLVLVSGDADFVPAVRQLIEDGLRVEIMFWDHASKQLSGLASKFVSLNAHLEFLRHKR